VKKNLFEMGPKFEDGWSSDNKQKAKKDDNYEILAPNKHNLIIQKEKRRGKSVIIVKEFFINKDELKSLLKELKKILGCGGTIKNRSIEFQGDIADRVKNELIKRGFRFKNR